MKPFAVIDDPYTEVEIDEVKRQEILTWWRKVLMDANTESAPKMMKMNVENVTVVNCVHCHMEHKGLEAKQLDVPIDSYTHSVMCPFKSQPIYLRLLVH